MYKTASRLQQRGAIKVLYKPEHGKYPTPFLAGAAAREAEQKPAEFLKRIRRECKELEHAALLNNIRRQCEKNTRVDA